MMEDIMDLHMDPPIVENKTTGTLSLCEDLCEDAMSEVEGESNLGYAIIGDFTLIPALP
jgi:hypothetical protein